ncbi:MAG: succinyldiaminopimelate transaminase [Propionibacteriaceae bacterium]|jgi:succinyldiaminopimelate transaminase|nr:succinyldiaminopimelate transaminase [Propionibacteriaceae bacterium]
MKRLGRILPDFPWDTIAEAKTTAGNHPGGVCDLSVGTPVDPAPAIGQAALARAADSPGYPQVWGTPALRQAIIGYLGSRWGAAGLTEEGVTPVVGTKELVAWLPTLLGLGPGDTVVIPAVAYPTYAVGAIMVGATVVPAATPEEVADVAPALVWTNSPSNPTGAVDDVARCRAWIEYARAKGAVLAADECYGEFGWTAEPASILHPDANAGSLDGLVAAYSLSKRSNLAGYRAGFAAGDPELVTGLVGLRKHLGMMVATPVQAAMVALLGDQAHVIEQRGRYAARRRVLAAALKAAGFRVDLSDGGLYLWATRGEPGRATVSWLADRGVLVAPGDFYGDAGADHVRVALTATDERVAAAADRIAGG